MLDARWQQILFHLNSCASGFYIRILQLKSKMASSDSENSDVEISNEEEQQSEEQSEGSEAEDAPTKEVEEGEESVAEETREKEPNSARLARTIFIGNLKANFELKVNAIYVCLLVYWLEFI